MVLRNIPLAHLPVPMQHSSLMPTLRFSPPIARVTTRYVAGVRAEYAHYAPDAFTRGRAGILQGFLNRTAIYASDTAHFLWDAPARLNLRTELEGYRAALSEQPIKDSH